MSAHFWLTWVALEANARLAALERSNRALALQPWGVKVFSLFMSRSAEVREGRAAHKKIAWKHLASSPSLMLQVVRLGRKH